MRYTEITLWDFIKHPSLFFSRSMNYFTNWVLLLILFYKFTYRYFDLHILVLFITFVSCFIVFIYPRYFQFIDKENQSVATVGGAGAHLLNIVFHVVPLVLVFIWVPRSASRDYLPQLNAIVLLLIYIILYNPEVIYGIKSDIVVVFLVLSVLTVSALYRD